MSRPPKSIFKWLTSIVHKPHRSGPAQIGSGEDDDYKASERRFFDRLAKSHNFAKYDWRSGSVRVPPSIRSPYLFLERWLAERCPGKALLDFGCGEGVYSAFPAKHGAMVVGVDFSRASLSIAQQRAKLEGVQDRILFCEGDCEALALPDDSFDIVISCGALSCLYLPRAVREIARVLKPDGQAVLIDTLGHNPLLNLRRAYSAWRGRITHWERRHILELQDLKLFRRHFRDIQAHFFDLSTLAPALLARRNGSFGRLVERCIVLDQRLLEWPLIQKYAFKIALCLSGPKKVLN